jgi:PAS domain S-box-containing protein
MMSPLRILLLEDSVADTELIREHLAAEHVACDVTRVDTRDAFLTALAHGGIDLVLSDDNLASFDGLSALKLVRNADHDLPFIFVSGSGEESAIEAFTNGATDYVSKARLAWLAPSVRRALGEARERGERKKAEAALQENEEKWKAIFENNPTMYFMVDADGNVASVNHFGAEQLGYAVDELKGTCVLKIFHPDDRAAAQKNMAQCLEQRGRAMSWELRKVRKDGSTLWVRETAKAMLLNDAPVALIVCEDITDRKWAERLTAQLFEISPDGICLVGPDYCYQRVNPAYERNVGMPAERIVGRHVADLLGTEIFAHPIQPNLERCFAGAEASYAEWINYPAGRRYVVVTYSPLRRGAERVEAVLVIVRDLTDHMLASEALRAAQAELAHANRVATMGQLTASIAHEVNQPITAAVTNAHAALRWLEAIPPNLEEVRQAVGKIVSNGRQAGDVIGRIRALIKKAPPRKERYDLNEAIRDVISLSRNEMVRHGILLRTGLARGLPPVHGDRIQLQQVVLNLIVNAIEAMSGADEGVRELRISSEREASGDLLVAVRDTGSGFEARGTERVFEAFYTTKPDGLGLGLAICRSIIEAQGGRLWASANEPRGAVFQFTVPPEREG